MFTIGRLGRKTRVKVDNIRFYERQGLLAPEGKTPSGYRLYGEAAVRRLLVIKHAQRCGFTLAEIAKLQHLDHGTSASRTAVCRMLAEKKKQIDETVAALQVMSEALVALQAAGGSAVEGPVGSAESLLLSMLEARTRPPAGKEVPALRAAAGRAPVLRSIR
jgi:MerR family transcriptional regulator, Zn(II)-responsive regulator of zntA